MSELRFSVGDLVGHPGQHRDASGVLPIRLRIGETTVDDDAVVAARLEAILDGVLAKARATALAHHQCARCLLEWADEIEVEVTELFARHPHEEQSGIAPDLSVDLGPVIHDEISLSLIAHPLCQPDCLGLCSTCGADLNMAPCAGHGDDTASPFAALKQLFEAET